MERSGAAKAADWILQAEAIRFRYPDGLVALDNLNIDVRAGEVLSIVGPSGCGKSTLLSVLAGLKLPTSGTVNWNEPLVAHETGNSGKPRRRRLGLVFQRDTVLPWLTVEENVAFGLRYVTLTRDERHERVASLLKIVRMDDFRHAYPKRLSGGMRRRVALLMGIAPMPHVLLLDEPFAALDEPTRVSIHADLLKMVDTLGLTIILVTHDLAEAITLSDRLIVLTRRPARVARLTETGLGRPRDIVGIRATERYAELYAATWQELAGSIREDAGQGSGQQESAA